MSHNDHDHTGHSHGLTRSDEMKGVSDARLIWSVVLNQLLTIGQVIGGIFSGSLALLSDAAHNFNDANALLIAYIARRIARKEANERFTFGYQRAELIGAMINLTTLGVVGLYLVYEAVMRFISPEPIVGWIMAAAAGLAIVVDVGTAVLLWAMAKGSLNVRAAFIHNITDALGSVAVLLGAATVIWLDWTWIDPLLTLLIAGYVLYQVATLLPQAARILMEGSPPDLDLSEVEAAMQDVAGVAGTHHLHVWQLDEQRVALEAHVLLEDGVGLDKTKAALKEELQRRFGIAHSTLELERDHCGDA
jgi:cobalt-zinc-cadmium efflux system protein